MSDKQIRTQPANGYRPTCELRAIILGDGSSWYLEQKFTSVYVDEDDQWQRVAMIPYHIAYPSKP